MKLYTFFRSSASFRVRIALNLKGLAYDPALISLPKGEHLAPAYTGVNPSGLVPALQDGDQLLTQSLAIMEYLDERFPHPPLLPVYPVQRALSRLWITRVEREWSSRLDVLMSSKSREPALSKARKELRESLVAVAPIFAEKPFFMHDEFTLVDCCVTPILWRLKVVDIALPERTCRPMLKYMQTMFARESFRLSLSEAELEMQD